ncbi:MAG: hypothetical protein IJV17_02425 [Prevotella sp.]|nr:hypothetical protein [Prevotella sp.]
MRVTHDIASSPVPDFLIAEKYIYEPMEQREQCKVYFDIVESRQRSTEGHVGGKKKKQKQIQSAEQGYVVKDDIETGYGNIIPLWQFGLTY